MKDNEFDLALLDLRMPGMNGMEGLKNIKNLYPNQKLAILSGVAEEHHVKKALELGVIAYFPKTLSAKALVKAIEMVVVSGHRFIPMDETGLQLMPSYYDDSRDFTDYQTQPTTTQSEFKSEFLNHLTKREKEVMFYIAQGLPNKEIATEMNLKPATIKVLRWKTVSKA